jgi:hypothetical protein
VVQCGEKRAIGCGEAQSVGTELALRHGDLVAQHEDFDVFVLIVPCQLA